jgi:(p)ppGpp synthase/HD superfamily hydrolase
VPQFPTFVDELPVTRRALEFAAEHHRGQRRQSDEAAFILHPLEVAQLLRGRGYPDEVVAAGVLHDSLEDTDATPLELEQRFGPAVAALVCSVSEPSSGGTYAQRKARLRSAMEQAGPESLAVYAADKVAKVRELRMTLARDWSAAVSPDTADKLHHYWASLALLESLLAANPLVGQLRFELEALATLPPRTPGALPAAQHAGS